MIAFKLEKEGGFEKMEELQKHPNVQIYNEVEKIINKYLEEDDSQPIS
jgi:hypothetical protein